jgi:hypothetical protein
MSSMSRIGAMLVAGALAIAAPAQANDAIVVTISSPLNLGSVVAATSGDTVFRISPSNGGVTVVSGSGRRMTTGAVQALVSVTCFGRGIKIDDSDGDQGAGNDKKQCDKTNLPFRIGAVGSPTGRAKPLTNFSVSMGTASLVGSVSGTNPIAFTIGAVPQNQTKTFYVAADFPIAGGDSGKPSGDGVSGFYINVVTNSGTPVVMVNGTATVRALRGMSLTKSSDLTFGKVSRPLSGSGTVTIDAAAGTRTTSNVVAFPTPAFSAASFQVSGEGGQSFSVSIPSSFQLTGAGTLTVTTNHTVGASPTLSGSLGAAGTYNFSVGGSMTLTSTTPLGGYSGVLPITVDYN